MDPRKRGVGEISSSHFGSSIPSSSVHHGSIAIKVPPSAPISTSGLAKTQSSDDNEEHDDYVRITPLGAGNEVGRSCILITYVPSFALPPSL